MRNISVISKFVLLMAILFVSIFTLELAFRVAVLKMGLFQLDVIRIGLFSLAHSAFITFFLRFFKPATMRRLTLGIIILLTILYLSQHIFYLTVNGFYSFSMTGDVAKGITFVSRIINNLRFSQALYLIPITVIVTTLKINRAFSTRLFDIRYNKGVKPLYTLLFAVVMLFISVQTISSKPVAEDEDNDAYNYTDRDLYESVYSPHLAIDRFGLLTYARIDIKAMVSGEDESRDETTMREHTEAFFEDYEPHESNDRTGFFEDKNLIMILAESLEPYGMNEHFMPNLTSMRDNAMIFDNYYAPLYYRYTADTEFMMQTSFYPDREVQLSMEAYKDNTFPNTLPNLFKDENYDTSAHHNYTDYFYPRSEFHPETIGFDYYKDAVDMNLIEEPDGMVSDHQWTSDKEMFERTLGDVLDSEQFFSYYLTVSGHLPYDDTQPMSLKNMGTIETIIEEENLDIEDEDYKYYLAAQYEFDLALGYLIETLENEGVLDDTVIMVASDHYAYGLNQPTHEDHSETKDLDETRLNMHNVPMMLYNPALEETHVDNTISSVDVMPTIANLFNLESMNYNQVMGDDVFNEKLNEVWFQDSSFLTDHYFMDISEGQSIGYFEEGHTKEEVQLHYNRMIHRSQINRFVLQNDYFGEDEDEEDSEEQE